jgi:KDO2-lipid IV(A) lauroyltransferase
MARLRKFLALKRFFHAFKYRIGEYALWSFMALLPRIPRSCLALFFSVMARLTFMLLWKYRQRMGANIENALGQQIADPAERRDVLRRAWRNFALGVLDTMVAVHMPRERIAAAIALDGEEHLQRALAKGKGVIALSAHLGAFTMIGPRLGASGYAFSVLVKHPNDARLAQLMTEYRRRAGVGTISAKPRQEAVRGILKALRKNGVVLVIADEFKSRGIEVNFLGQRAAAPRGPAALALRTGAAVVPVFAPRAADGSVSVQISPEIELARHEDLEADVAAATRLFTSRIEAAVRRFPDQWNWIGFPRRKRISRVAYGRRYRGAKKVRAMGAESSPIVGQRNDLEQKRKQI